MGSAVSQLKLGDPAQTDGPRKKAKKITKSKNISGPHASLLLIKNQIANPLCQMIDDVRRANEKKKIL